MYLPTEALGMSYEIRAVMYLARPTYESLCEQVRKKKTISMHWSFSIGQFFPLQK